MASTCPKCHRIVESEGVCCAGIKYTWKCKSCGKLSTGFVVPYGRCFLCGGAIEVIHGYSGDQPELVAIAQEAVQYELDMYHFYRIAMERTSDPTLRAILEELYHKEEDHLAELEEKYHLHPETNPRTLTDSETQIATEWIFQGIDFESLKGHVLQVYDRAIEMERRTRDRFLAHALSLPEGPQREMYRELAAEEEEHVSMLETELQRARELNY